MSARIAAFPMYDFPELRPAHDALWSALRRHLTDAGVLDTPPTLERRLKHAATWSDPRLLLGQGCEYPLATSFAHCVRLVATPRYGAPGCEGATYRSAILVRNDDPADTLADLRGRRCVINEADSNSGMNLLRASIAPLAHGGRFFELVVASGSHRKSVETVATGRADVAAVDCVSFAHFRRLYPASVAPLRVLAWTAATPSLPFITAAATSDATLEKLRRALAQALADRTLVDAREQLLLDGVDLTPAEGFGAVLRLERRAAELGYPTLN